MVGSQRIGPGEPVFIVAEAGVNHNGSVATALQMVDAAAQAGVNAVKFQMFRAAELATASAPTATYQKHGGQGESQQAMLARLELSLDGFARIRQRCDEAGVIFLATPFGEGDLDRLLELGVAAIKIASTDLTNGPLLRAAAVAGLPLILSTGASKAEEIHAAVGDLHSFDAAVPLILLHCVSCYPTPPDAMNLRAVATLQSAFGVPCGLSDHTACTRMGGWAAAAGACLLEKHLTMDHSAPGPDHAMSLTARQLSEYVGEVRQVERALGDGVLGMDEIESEVRAVAGKSVVAAVDIGRGTKLRADMLTLKRPGTGIAPSELAGLVGRCTAVDIPHDKVLSWDMMR
jgi:sialic acid synthase SpsE